MYQTIEKSRHTKFIYDLDISKDDHTNLQLKTFTLTLELNPESQIYPILFIAHFSSICRICKKQMGCSITSKLHEILQIHSSGGLVNIISISESKHKTMIYEKSYKTACSSVLTEFYATQKLNHYFYIDLISVRPLPLQSYVSQNS